MSALNFLNRWRSWVVVAITHRGGQVLNERPIWRCFTRKGADREIRRWEGNLQLLLASMDSLGPDGCMTWVDYEARPR